ncbi:origin recognition complex subunit 3 [Varanus komodoensis]|uniref:Origin recognition complex subunit 3 n=1 Tax=Varanus komodoensis TaxID=61221 RepID=A0A8D2KWW9_VARKO|nr:origin recognition complex subunit 3 [Varanus komodoensis]XP_044277637.1 origin recognition complex subunit 3 [Varanus komodoensis]
MTTCSVSKGCFVFKPASKKRKISSAADYFSKDNNDLEDHGLRFDTCQLLWKQIKCETEQLQEDLNKKLFNDLIQFLRQSHSDFKEKKTEWACRIKSSEIPAAAVVLGVNVTDHDLTFKSLSEILQNDVTPFVVSLRSKECPDIKHLLQKMMIQLMDCHVEVDSSEEEESSKISPSRIHCSVANLTKWYRNITKTTDSTASYKKTSSSRHWESPPVVVIFKDMESFTTKVLQDFIIISSHCIHEFPLVLIFGMATSPMIIHKLLPCSVSSLLCIELFQSLSCKEHLTRVIDKLLLTSQFPFKLSEKVLQVLINLFLYHDFSVQNFIKGFQLSLLEHFYSHPLSVLCCELQEAKKRVKCLSHSQCENIRRLPSFRRFVESQVSDKQTALLTDDDYLKETAQALLQDLHTYHENFYPVLKCLHAVTSSLPKYPLGKQIRELYCACLEKKVWETEEYESAMQLVRMLAKNDLVDVLEKCVAILASCPEKHLGNTSEKLKEYLGRLRNPEAEASDDHEKSISSLKELQKKTDLYHLQKTLLEMKDSRRLKKLTQFEMLRFEVVDFIDSLVKNFLAPAEMQTLHEVMYFSAANTLREHLNAAPRVALHTALNNPYFYLKNESLKSDAGSISNTAPDICIAYKLHLECGRLINLVDWLEAFSTVVTAAENPNSTVKDQMDDVTHARFVRAVSELELLGFIKPTKQKTDHVARLTWGSC